VGFEPSATDDTLFGTDASVCNVVKRRRPDNLWLSERVCIIVECDENGGHGSKNYLPECDASWMTDMAESLVALYSRNKYGQGEAPRVFVLRFNPDERDAHRKAISLEKRIHMVAERVRNLCALSRQDLHRFKFGVPNVEYYFYHSKCSDMIQYARSKPDHLNVVRVVP
jgi:hypothetical protein